MKKALWKPSAERAEATNMARFIGYVNNRYGKEFASYEDLYRWSIGYAPAFWESVWDFGEVTASRSYDQVVTNFEDMFESEWFAGARLNFAENLLRFRDDRPALVFKSEAAPPVRMSYAGLYDEVARLSASLRGMGIGVGDRVAGFIPNMCEAVIAMLAATSIGAIWSSCSPDFGIRGVLDRFGQIRPRVLFTADGYHYNGKIIDCRERVAEISKEIPEIERVVVIPYAEQAPNWTSLKNAVLYREFLSNKEGLEIEFAQLPFSHPVYIMYSSGTTGIPKCIVHGAGGTLIQHLKELKLHVDLKREDKIFYFTTCGWMMWNWLVSSLSVGATLVLYDGSPFYPESDALWKLAEEERISVFGTSAKYLAALEKEGTKPGRQFNLRELKTVLSTGSPLSKESFEYVYRDIKQDLCLSSISGGTDILSCFALGNPTGPVYAGELQCRGLGMKVESFDQEGKSVIHQKGELVCTQSFPSMPVYFWDDPDDEKYRKAYFDVFPNVWRHGDYIEINDEGGVIIYGRSDATLNPGGVRIGTAEIYRQVESLPEIIDSIVIGHSWKNDDRIVLFVKLADGISLNDELKRKIITTIRGNTTPRHVPAKIIAIKDIPYTLSGKKVEMAVRNIVHNQRVDNRDALANPEILELYRDLDELRDD